MGGLLAISLFLLAAIDIGFMVFFYIKNGVEKLDIGDKNELYKCVFQGMFKVFLGGLFLVESLKRQGQFLSRNLVEMKWAFIIQLCWGVISFVGGYVANKKGIKPVDDQNLSDYFFKMSLLQGLICILVGVFGFLYVIFV